MRYTVVFSNEWILRIVIENGIAEFIICSMYFMKSFIRKILFVIFYLVSLMLIISGKVQFESTIHSWWGH